MTMNENILTEKPFAVGNTAELYDWQPGWVLKLFKDRYTRGAVDYEWRIHHAVQQAGIPVPKVGEQIIEMADRFGLLYEKVDGQPMARILEKHPWRLFAYARRLAALHARMHAASMRSDGIPDIKERTAWKINHASGLTEEVRRAALQALAQMPDGDRLCHGDFHVENVLVDGDDFFIIDWVDAAIGSPMADVARTSIILLGAAAGLPKTLGALLRLIHHIYLRQYARLCPFDQAEYQRWLPIVAAGRMSEGIDGSQAWLAAQAASVL
jgi:uncharacterized protein (TIGR02172 family)